MICFVNEILCCQGLKSHAVTLFEVGKLTDEGIGNFSQELKKVNSVDSDEGEARRYFDHAVNLRYQAANLRETENFYLRPYWHRSRPH